MQKQLRSVREVTEYVSSLMERREWAIHHLLNRIVQNDRELERFEVDVDQWKQSTLSILKTRSAQSDISRFDVLGTIPELPFSWAYNAEHNHWLAMLQTHIDILTMIAINTEQAILRDNHG